MLTFIDQLSTTGFRACSLELKPSLDGTHPRDGHAGMHWDWMAIGQDVQPTLDNSASTASFDRPLLHSLPKTEDAVL